MIRLKQRYTTDLLIMEAINSKNCLMKGIASVGPVVHIINLSLNGDIDKKGEIGSGSFPGDSYFNHIHLVIELYLPPNENYLASITNENVENMLTTKNYAVFGDTVFLESPQSSLNITIIKGKGITEWTDGDGEVWKLME